MHAQNVRSIIVCASIVIGLQGCYSGAEYAGGTSTARSSAAFAGLQRTTSKNSPVSLGAAGRTTRDQSSNLCVISFNMEHRDNPDQTAIMAEHLKSDLDAAPDFVLLQEVMFRRSRYKGEDNTAAALAEQLGYYSQGTKRTSDSEGVAIVSRYPFAYYAARNLKSQTSRLLLGFRRVSVMGEFLVPGKGRVRIVNVHLTNWGFEEHVRYKQLEETLEWMAQRERQVHADITILGGDFNMPPDGDEITLIDKANQSKEFEFHNWNTSNPTRGSRGNPSMRTDYLFVSAPDRNVRMLGETLLWNDGLPSKRGNSAARFWPSDHIPVVHEYAFSKANVTQLAHGREDTSIAGQ